ncbi:heavy metal translocating P-type ATPase [Sphaerochaeta pleomorpha]|jgi:Cd2+/Zn2+-exporting ATPase|uniref:P-type Zn(2+) transporter n=1 Tax=Sphaerochaeta pleomorpha (strain ATCC BAA-1885 / DSM 22778 / Grapes) TaxID=158190 RepID=G8QWI3_SPHPG|nr:heavy metal translocating P-type ATPase [Sphaerochaeta pleomorpha]MCK9340484.1 cadmium-translocating P-type ATPase [Synergistaceae bacterium]MDD2559190.1 heavy metal translocating P-type ATPase [Bacteroidales bacterium]MDD4449268.1 heavy metal translocating P-type ATPase [Sphaerochaeta sp.]OHD33954.1 MAG: cadmium-translocating P-type ATPase [Spirochaetes bacterium GWC2_52_13]AEV30559.1 heavy metal-translocating P-type ATPase, Cd/Co/Hg/Pb/Zn-transporting [Sphaerochaeta pleomorpha str. Grapes
MSKKENMKKYRINGLDCAQCANEIESGLRKIEGFEDATVSFGTESIVIPESGLQTAQDVIARIEPDARIVGINVDSHTHTDHGHSHDHNGTSGDDENTGWRVVRMVLALVLTGAGIIFNETLHATQYQVAEYVVLLSAYLLVGGPVLLSAGRNILRGRLFDEMFLMSVATLGAIAIHELPEAVAVMLFYSIGEYIQDLAVGRSRRSISSLMDLRPDSARVISDDGMREVSPDVVEVGAIIEVRPGERIPLDGEVTQGESAVDTSALTGESVPRSVGIGDTVLSGFVNDSGTIRIRVTKPYKESSVSRILELVEDAAARKAPTEKFISKFASVYTPIVVGLAALVAFLPPLFVPGAVLSEWVYRALVVLVISCPCALVISVPLGYFGGIGGASRKGILIKGANYVDALRDVSTVVVDKTGTLTKGVFKVTKTVPRNGFTADDVLRLAASAEAHSTHPIARSIREAYKHNIDMETITDVKEEKGYGVIAHVGGRKVMAGSDRLLHRENIEHGDCDAEGTVVYVVLDKSYVGHLVIADEIKAEAAEAIADLRAAGVQRVVMLTGDNEAVARSVAEVVKVDLWYAGLLPEDKVRIVEQLSKELPKGQRLAFVGDGINDAPVLMRADVGFAMGALGSDAAIEAADVVLMDDKVNGIGSAIRVAKHTRSVVMQNISLALLVKFAFLALGAVGFATMWEAVIADVGVSLLAVLNSTRTLRYSRRIGDGPK